MKPADRYAWIVKHMQVPAGCMGITVDVLDRHFVDVYIDATGANCDVMPYGADKCPQLGRDLSVMFKTGALDRYASGIEGLAG